MREKVKAGQQPWLAGYGKLDEWFQDLTNRGYPKTPGANTLDRYKQYKPLVLGYTLKDGEVRPPVTDLCSDATSGEAQELMFDARAAYASALHWIVTQDATYAKKAIEIINAWPNTVRTVSIRSDCFPKPGRISGSVYAQTRLMIGGSLPQMIFAAEIIRATYSGWSQAEQTQFNNFLLNKMYNNTAFATRTSQECVWTDYNTNWGALGAETRMAIAIYTDRDDLYNDAVLDYKFFINNTFSPYGKYMETCRAGNGGNGCYSTAGGDLPHTQMTLQALTAMAEMGEKQGVNLYGYTDPVDGHSLLTTLKYHAPFMGYNDEKAAWARPKLGGRA